MDFFPVLLAPKRQMEYIVRLFIVLASLRKIVVERR